MTDVDAPQPSTQPPSTPPPSTPQPSVPLSARPARDVTGVVANLLAAVAVGSVVLTLLSTVLRPGGPFAPVQSGLRVLDLVPTVMVLVAVGLALAPGLRRYGWLVATLGLLGPIGLYLQGQGLTEDLLALALAIALGVQLGGVLLAFGGASRPGRWAIGVGLGFGVVASHILLLSLADALQRLLGRSSYSDELLLGALALVTAVAGIVLALRPRGGLDGPAPSPVPGAAIVIVAVAAVARALAAGWQLVLDGIASSSTGGFSQDRAETVETLNEAVLLAVGVLAAAVLAVVAYRRGGAGLARWVVAAFAVAALAVGGNIDFAVVRPYAFGLLLPAALGAILGGLAVNWLDRWAPWDALGVLAMVVGLLLDPEDGGTQYRGLSRLTIFGLALTLTAGLARLSRTGPGLAGPDRAGPDRAGRALAAAEVGISAALGFAALILCRQLFNGIRLTSAPVERAPLELTLTLSGAAVVLVLLFWLGRSGPASAPEPVDEAGAAAPDVLPTTPKLPAQAVPAAEPESLPQSLREG